MDLGTLIGIVGGFALIIGSILMGGSLSSFIDIPSIVIVIGGTFAATLISERMGNVFSGFKVALNAFTDKTTPPEEVIGAISDLAQAARKDGILALEKVEVENPFLAKGVRMAVDGIDPEEIRANLSTEMISLRTRHKRGQALFKFMEGSAPSMGMIGTLIGLVSMLQNLSDPSAIGPSMAVALLTTFYGAIIAFVVCGPIAAKLASRTTEESAVMTIVIEGVDGILKGENPRMLQEKLEGYLAPKKRTPAEKAA